MRSIAGTIRTSLLHHCVRAAVACASAMCAASSLGAQAGAGSMSGRITDSTGHGLSRANVFDSRTHTGTVTNASGFYRITDVAPGQHVFVVRYIGFAPDSFTVRVRDGEHIDHSVSLRENMAALAAIVVREKVAGEAEAINAKRTADNIIDVETSDVIKSRPDPNVADAVGRLPGVSLERDEGEGKYVQIRGTEPRFSNVTINGAHVPSPEGDVRVVKLDVIPSDLVSEIRLSKTLTADMEADAIGGSVDLVSKTPEPGREYATVTAAGGHIQLLNNNVGQFAGTFGKRVGTDQKLGFLIDGSFDRNNRAINDLEPVWDVAPLGGKNVPFIAEGDARDYTYYRTRFGAGGDLDYRIDDNSVIYLKGLFSEFHNYGTRYRADAVPGDGTVTPTSETTGTATGGTMTREVQTRRPDEQIYSLSGGGMHLIDGMTLDYTGSWSHGEQRTRGARNTAFALDNVDYTYDVADPKFPKYTATSAAATDPSQFAFSSFSVNNSVHQDRDAGAKVNLSVPYALGDRSSTLKFGAALRDEAADVTDHTASYSGYNGTFTLGQALAAFADPHFYFNRYALGPLPSDGGTASFENSNLANFTLNAAKTLSSAQNNFTGGERIYAGYAMNTVDIGAARVIAGVRVEATHAAYDGFTVVTPTTGPMTVTPVSGAHNYSNVFPSVQVRYAVNGATNLRLSYTQGIARPDFGDLPPTQIVADKKKTVKLGNPDLDPTHSDNYDMIVEHYIGSIGLLSAGAFYKNIDNFIFTRDFALTTGAYSGYTASQPQNGQTGHVAGLELTWQQRFTWLPGVWRGLGVNTNYTIASSKAVVPTADSVRTTTLPRQGATNANAELTYDYDKLSMRGGLTWNSKNLWEYGDDAASDIYLSDHLQFDANLSYLATPTARVFLQMLNMNNAVFGFYQGSAATPIQREFYGWTTYLGVKLGGG